MTKNGCKWCEYYEYIRYMCIYACYMHVAMYLCIATYIYGYIYRQWECVGRQVLRQREKSPGARGAAPPLAPASILRWRTTTEPGVISRAFSKPSSASGRARSWSSLLHLAVSSSNTRRPSVCSGKGGSLPNGTRYSLKKRTSTLSRQQRLQRVSWHAFFYVSHIRLHASLYGRLHHVSLHASLYRLASR